VPQSGVISHHEAFTCVRNRQLANSIIARKPRVSIAGTLASSSTMGVCPPSNSAAPLP
jgi:hypothetical protein